VPGSADAVRRFSAIRLSRAIVGFLICACAATILVDFYRDARTENSLAAIYSAGGLAMRNDGVRSRPVIGIDLDATTVYDTGEIRHRAHVTDATLLIVARFGQLEELSLEGADVTDAGLVSLSGLQALRRVNISHTRVTDLGLVYLQGLRELRFIDLRGTRVTPAGIRQLRLALPKAELRADKDVTIRRSGRTGATELIGTNAERRSDYSSVTLLDKSRQRVSLGFRGPIIPGSHVSPRLART
jgi:hypothetical protein